MNIGRNFDAPTASKVKKRGQLPKSPALRTEIKEDAEEEECIRELMSYFGLTILESSSILGAKKDSDLFVDEDAANKMRKATLKEAERLELVVPRTSILTAYGRRVWDEILEFSGKK